MVSQIYLRIFEMLLNQYSFNQVLLLPAESLKFSCDLNQEIRLTQYACQFFGRFSNLPDIDAHVIDPKSF
jgi:hypothetical protein